MNLNAQALDLSAYPTWFEPSVVRWFMMTMQLGEVWIDQAVVVDDADAVTDDVMFSSSLIDVTTMLSGNLDFFMELETGLWGPSISRLCVHKMVDIIW